MTINEVMNASINLIKADANRQTASFGAEILCSH